MKRLFISIIAILLLGWGIAYAIDGGHVLIVGQGNQPTIGKAAGHGAGDLVGQGKYDSDPHKIFRFVRYVSPNEEGKDTIVSADFVVIWDTGASGDDAVTVTTTVISQDTRVAGILVTDILPPISTDTITTAANDIGKRNWGWVQTYGLAEGFLSNTGADAVAGQALGTSSITGEIATYVVSGDEVLDWMTQTAVSSRPYLGNAGFFYDSSTAGDSNVQVFLKCE